jgi:hypothetical protein|tara:strand:- start:98 stop:715 length:618 start_codon:yes stop_codon:yes gene_type:complete
MWHGRDAQGAIVAAASGRTGGIQREPETVPFDDEHYYGQRVEALDDLAERVDLEEQGWEPGEGPLEYEADPYAKVAMEGQPTAPKGGTYVDALYVKGSREDRQRRRLAEAKPSDLETQASPWQTDDPNRLSIPASRVLGHIDHKQLMIDASSTGGGQTDSHLIPFHSTPDNIGMLKKGKWRAEGQRKASGDVHWQMYPDNTEETK